MLIILIVLILVVMEDALARDYQGLQRKVEEVLFLVVMEDALAHSPIYLFLDSSV